MTIVPAVPQILEQFQPPSDLYTTLLISIWELGEGIGPFAIGPLAEIYGRLPILHLGNLGFMLAMVGAGLSTSASMLVGFRFLAALFVTPLTLGPAIVADLFRPEERGAAMSLAMALPLLAPPTAPIIGSFISAALGWRWAIWIVIIPSALVALLLLIVYRETHGPTIERKRNKKANRDDASKETDQSQRPGLENLTGHSATRAFLRPLTLLFFAPSVSISTIYMALAYGMFYIVMATLTEALEGVYGFEPSLVGLGFLGLGMDITASSRLICANWCLAASGMIIGTVAYGSFADRYLEYRARLKGKGAPEDRLPFLLFGAATLPFGYLLYGWSLQYRLHWMAPIIGTALLGFSWMLVQISIENYLADAFENWSASAISIIVILRASTGAILPLAAVPLYQKLGYGWGNTLLGFLGAVFIPMLVLLVLRGERLRNSPRLADAVRRETASE